MTERTFHARTQRMMLCAVTCCRAAFGTTLAISLGISQLPTSAGATPPSTPDWVAAYKAGDYAKAATLLRPLAEQGNPTAEASLGVMYAFGRGVPRDRGQAFHWLRLAAEQNYARAQTEIVDLHLFTDAADDALPEILIWCGNAANAGDALGDACLGRMYANGKGVRQDIGQGIAWWRKAAELGSTEAEAALGSTYQLGHGVPVDYVQAMHWFTAAAEHGNPYGMYNLGVMALKGQGGPPDFVQAHMWMDLALPLFETDQARTMAAQLRDLAAQRMSPDQIAQAQGLAVAWRQHHPAP